jgi:hypothetical protein
VPALKTAYSQPINVTPAANYSFAVTAGVLPAGLSLNSTTGVISGTPTKGGQYSFTITATGLSDCKGSRSYSGSIASNTCPVIALSSLPDGQVGQFYSQSVVASPDGNYKYAVTNGELPPGLKLNGASGLIKGYPTQAGTYTFTISATKNNDCKGERTYILTIGGGTTARIDHDPRSE